MAIGTSILLIIVGAILRFAISWSPHDVSLDVIGVILIIAGAVGLVLGLTMLGPWSYRSCTSHRVVNSTAGQPTMVREETIENEAPPVARY